MARGDYIKTTYTDEAPPALESANLNNSENKVEELDTWAAAPATDTIAEATAGAGVTIDGLLIKDGAIPIYTGLFPEDPRGLTCSNAADADHDITISAGGAADSTRVIWLALASAITKQIDAAWAAGTNAGGMDDGAAPVANTPYYVFLIRKDSDGSIDALFSLSSTAPTMPAGYTYKRRFMSVHTDAAANIYNFDQIADMVWYKTSILNRARAALGSTNRILVTTSVPPLMIGIYSPEADATTQQYLDIKATTETDSLPSTVDDCDCAITANVFNNLYTELRTSATSQIAIRGSNNAINVKIKTRGWIDDRGRIA